MTQDQQSTDPGAGTIPDRNQPSLEELYADVGGLPEHSVSLMARAGGGRVLEVDGHLFYTSSDWIVGVGYPREGAYDAQAFSKALQTVLERTGATRCHTLTPTPLPGHENDVVKRDVYYLLDTARPVPSRMRNVARRAAERLRLEVGTAFTSGHRRLWAEFLARVSMDDNVQALYARVEDMLATPDCEIELLNAWTEEGELAACLVVDTFMPRFDTYVLGAHSKKVPAPHASDALFALMIERAGQRKKPWLHLGLGVGPGIARFKKKWGGFPAFPYVESRWHEARKKTSVNVILHSIEASLDTSMDERARRDHDYAQRPYRMLWKVEKNGRTSWVGGTAHFFCKSFERSFKKLFRRVDTVLFEGHLDEASLEKVALAGKTPPDAGACLYDLLTPEERAHLARVVRGPEGPLWRLLNVEAEKKADVDWYLRRTRHWYAFFALWCAFLERNGWRYSVDLEAWRVAHGMGLRVLAMEDLDEQLEALRSVPVERAVNYLRNCGRWPSLLRRNARSFLAGDLMGLTGTSTEFPTRTGHIIDRRDQRFRERMRPYLEAGNAIALVGSAHLVNLRSMLREDGFTVTPTGRGLFQRLFGHN